MCFDSLQFKLILCEYDAFAGLESLGCEEAVGCSALPLPSDSGFLILAANREGIFLFGLVSASSKEISNCINLNKHVKRPFSKYSPFDPASKSRLDYNTTRYR